MASKTWAYKCQGNKDNECDNSCGKVGVDKCKAHADYSVSRLLSVQSPITWVWMSEDSNVKIDTL